MTPSTNIAGTDGTWGVYPFLPSGNLLVSDIENGLFVLRDQTRNLDASSGRLGFAELSLGIGRRTPGTINVRVQRTRRARGRGQRAVRDERRLGDRRRRLHGRDAAR